MKCKDCSYKKLEKGNGSPNRYYCEHPIAYERAVGIGSPAREVCRTKRGCTEVTIKTSPKWCPLKNTAEVM